MTYSDKLRDPRWQKKRLKVMEYANWRCQICGRKDLTLHCHHSYYTRGKQPWQYPNGSIICICEKCHDKIHGTTEKRAVIIDPKIPLNEETGPVEANAAKARFSALRELLENTPDEPPKKSWVSPFRALLEQKPEPPSSL